ncbi:hypothetical protein DYB37_010483 [Aphanomyces astaci]|uniref:Uncharacterized protein n=1 Tax=Aphanomyces astaci TaxID=112090 RepID=A0A3R7AXX1_APHAT|nr:hypothetical protein DYB37_010483 [Aphanomyces astaci]
MSVAVEASVREAEDVRVLCRQLEAGKSRTIQMLQEYLRGDLSFDEERKLLREIDFKRKAGSDLSAANMEISQRAADHDQVFMQMKQVTGASSLQDVVDKFAAQNSSNASLEKEKARAEARLAAAKASKEGAIKSLNDLKASGIGGIELNRDVYTALESEILVAKGQLKGNKAAYDCLDGVLAAVRQGASSLVQRLVPFDDLLEINDEALAALTGKDSANDLLAVAEIKFAKVLELVGQQNGSVGGFNGYGGDADDGFDDHARGGGDVGDDVKHAVWTPTGNNDPVVHRNNIRVQARPGASAPSSGPPDSARSDVSSAAGGGGLLEDEEEATDGVMDVKWKLMIFDDVQLAEKRKNAAERGISDEELTSKLKKKNQNEADKRLSANPTSRLGLPPGVCQKDDAITKSTAFVTQMPALL